MDFNYFHIFDYYQPKPYAIMKRILFILAIIALVSCKEKETTFQVINNVTEMNSDMEYLDGTLWEVIVFCYRGEDIAKQINLDPIPPEGGVSNIITAEEGIEKVKVSFRFLPEESPFYDLSSNYRMYTVSYTYLTQEDHTEITIDDDTMLSNQIDSKNSNTILSTSLGSIRK